MVWSNWLRVQREEGELEKIRSGLSALLLFLLDYLSTSGCTDWFLSHDFWRTLWEALVIFAHPTSPPCLLVTAPWFFLEEWPFLCLCGQWVWDSKVGMWLRAGQSKEPVCLAPDQFRTGQSWTNQSISGLLLKHLRKKSLFTGIVKKKGNVPEATGNHLAIMKKDPAWGWTQHGGKWSQELERLGWCSVLSPGSNWAWNPYYLYAFHL